ncbi:MAG TPA: zinc ribbon domain-containing protein [Noviherbaspirillum sp.]|nr:zinc ribbon domain-containing protein [Noviherbaspirillum sp.]
MSNSNNEKKASAALMSGLDSLLAATDAFKNVRAIMLLGLTLVAATLVGGVFSAIAAKTFSFWLGGLGFLLAFVVFFYGLNAVGIIIMRDAQGEASGTMMDAVLLSLFTSHRLLGVAVLEFLIMLAVVLAIAVVLFVCKIPVLGPVLFTVVFPLSAILLGLLVFSLFYVMLPLAGPAVWAGCTVFQVIARLNVIARKKLVPVILNQLILLFITTFSASIIFFVVMTGVMFTSSLSAGIIGFGDLDLHSLMNMSGRSGHMVAGGIGGGLLFAVAAVIPMLILMKGTCIIYLKTTADLDFAQAEAQLGNSLDSVKKKAEEARDRARQLAEQQRSNAQTAAQAATATAAASSTPVTERAPACPGCHAPVSPDDAFCGECGHKLK